MGGVWFGFGLWTAGGIGRGRDGSPGSLDRFGGGYHVSLSGIVNGSKRERDGERGLDVSDEGGAGPFCSGDIDGTGDGVPGLRYSGDRVDDE